jgi:hypothetical protein
MQLSTQCHLHMATSHTRLTIPSPALHPSPTPPHPPPPAPHTRRGAVPADPRVLPDRIILVRHAQSEGNVNQATYTYLPDPQVPLVSVVCM